jgi:hypothetical protein
MERKEAPIFSKVYHPVGITNSGHIFAGGVSALCKGQKCVQMSKTPLTFKALCLTQQRNRKSSAFA